jgi:hypothetical protein
MVGSYVSNKLYFRLSIRRHFELADKQLAELHDELPERFDMAFAIVHRARELALKEGQAAAAKHARRISGPLSPAEAREINAAMLNSLPESKSDLLTIKQAAELAHVSERQLYRLTHLHTRVGKAIRIQRSDLRDLGSGFD